MSGYREKLFTDLCLCNLDLQWLKLCRDRDAEAELGDFIFVLWLHGPTTVAECLCIHALIGWIHFSFLTNQNAVPAPLSLYRIAPWFLESKIRLLTLSLNPFHYNSKLVNVYYSYISERKATLHSYNISKPESFVYTGSHSCPWIQFSCARRPGIFLSLPSDLSMKRTQIKILKQVEFVLFFLKKTVTFLYFLSQKYDIEYFSLWQSFTVLIVTSLFFFLMGEWMIWLMHPLIFGTVGWL